jgi:hypothetical protein
MKRTCCTHISPNPKVTLCDGTLLFAEGLAIKITGILDNVASNKNFKSKFKILFYYRLL